ncbi:hypothetical protein ABH905_002007 [Pseudomonas frederiksbergensis]|uniref:hypothetical protein n=1 Tax=Pseudomonas frederiksbergensis TaxID=104087 RepID=UPI003D2502FF
MTQSPINGKDLHASLVDLRNQLLELQPAGPGGFEGLIATALADLTKLTFRLAKSGSQFGRDATTPRAHFAIAMEAKRYRDSLRLEDIAGKIWIAAHELASDVDLWALCATSEMGDGVLIKLEQMLEDRGISLLMLDWTETPLPRLAVLLAASRTKVAQWCEQHTLSATASKIDAALANVAADAAFAFARDQLKKDASAGYSGLAALAEANRVWCEQVFSERIASQQAFGQYLTVLDRSRPAIVRPSIESTLDTALSTIQQAPGCIAILGPEGAGKSWLAARWWVTTSDQPILVIGGTQVADLIEPKEPLKTLAKLIAVQSGGDLGEESKRWLRRLHRWQDHPPIQVAGKFRFLVVLDGLNERSGMPWADTIVKLTPEVNKLGGRLLLTCRERFWDREVAPRLAGVAVTPVKVGDYKPEELDELLLQRGICIETIPERVRTFIRNPRICSVALDLLDRLSAQVDELTIERLLLEYWRRRLEERGDLIAHNIRDFDKLLRSHAKALLEDPGIQFDRDDWREHSGAAKRGDGRSVEHDLTDIEEGAFLRVVEDQEGFYEFKPDTVPFALGLLVARELQDELRKSGRNPAEVIDSIVEEVQGFDLVGEALRSAAGIACFEENYPPKARAALISAWLDLQNIPDSAYDSLTAYAIASPEGVLDATEASFDEHTNARRRQWLIGAILNSRDRPRVELKVEPRIGRWLARWSRTPRRMGARNEGEDSRLHEHAARISDKLNHLTPVEKDFLARSCEEVDAPEAMQLDFPAALLMAGRPQVAFAEGVLGWAFAWSLTGDFQRAEAELSWAVRLNRNDFPAFERNLRAAIETLLNAPHSDVSRKAAAIALRVLGTVASSEEADRLSPRPLGERRRRVENYCATDPFDPSSARPSNLGNAIQAANAIAPANVWSQFSKNQEDLELDWITAGLARFEADAIIPLLRTTARTMETRSQLSLRQLSWRLQRVSPLFDTQTLTSVLNGYKRLVLQPELIDEADKNHVTGSILLSLLPHFPANEQLQLYLDLPTEVGDWYTFRDVFKALDAAELETALSETESDPIRLRRVLFFASAHCSALTNQSRDILGGALTHDDPLVVTYASEVAYVARDTVLDERIIAAAQQGDFCIEAGEEAFWRARAVAAAIVSLERHGDTALIAPGFVGFAAEQLGGALDDRLVTEMDLTIERLLLPIQAPEPELGRLFLEVGRSGQETCRYVEDRADEDREQGLDALRNLATESEGPRQGIDEYTNRQKALREESDAYLRRLEIERAQALAREPDLVALKRLASLAPENTAAWVGRILAETDQKRLSTIRNFALGLSEALADTNPDSAAALLIHVKDAQSPVTIVVGDARIPQQITALFAGRDAEALSALKERAFDSAATDADLEALVFAAEAAGHARWLFNWIQREVESGIPGRVARALMVEGLRNDETGSSPLLARNWGPGFLGQVAEHARFAYNRNTWAKTWSIQAVSSSAPLDFWRWGELTTDIADIRAFHWFDPNLNTPMIQRFGSELFKRIRKSAEERTKKRKDTLFGLKKPNSLLSQLLS